MFERNRVIANNVGRIDRSACVFFGILTIIISSHNYKLSSRFLIKQTSRHITQPAYKCGGDSFILIYYFSVC